MDSEAISLAVIDPSNPLPRVTEAKETPLSDANLRANGEAKILSETETVEVEAGARVKEKNWLEV